MRYHPAVPGISRKDSILSRLIIVDHSLKGVGGHHFDYTLQIARAAAERQCEVIVAANRKFASGSRLEHYARILPIFRNTTYSPFSLLAGLRAMYQRPPLKLRSTVESQGITRWSGPEVHRSRPHARHDSTAARTQESLKFGSAQFGAANFGTGTAGKTTLPGQRLTSMLTRPFQFGIDRCRTLTKHTWNCFQYLQESSGRNRLVKQFASDCQQLFREVRLNQHDHVFLPAISDLDLAGLLTYWLGNPESYQPIWHMQFHFDVFSGRTPEYRSQLANYGPLRDLFDDIERAVAAYRIHYYATTTNIAQQYQCLSSRQIAPLTYPISDEFLVSGEAVHWKHERSEQIKKVAGDPLRINTHSGYASQHGLSIHQDSDSIAATVDAEHDFVGALPIDSSPILSIQPTERQRLQPGLSQVPSSTGALGNLFQSNAFFPTGHLGIPIVIAGGIRPEKGQKQLAAIMPALHKKIFQPGYGFLVCQRKERKGWWRRSFSLSQPSESPTDSKIHFLPHPLETKAYQQMIRSAGIGLLTYDSRNYANRRAGIFGEYLSAGVPVLVPAGCWMADQLEPIYNRYCQNLSDSGTITERWNHQDFDWAQWNIPTSNGTVSFDGDQVPATSWSRPLPKPAPIPTVMRSDLHDHTDLQNNGVNHEMEVAPATRSLHVRFHWVWPKEAGTYCRVQVDFCALDQSLVESRTVIVGRSPKDQASHALFRIPAAASNFRLRLSNAFHERNASINRIRIEVIQHASSQDTPVGANGLTYESLDQIPDRLSEMCRFFTHFRRHAQQTAGPWAAQHDPAQTLQSIFQADNTSVSWAA